MRIKNNIPALNARNRLDSNRSALAKNLEKLSSGYRINRAGDDAAGLTISEGMRALIAGMKQASHNATDGIGLIRTGEGALQEVHAMLERLHQLAVQSANGTYDDDVGRAALQKEADQICDEIDRIARSADFNDVALFQDIGLSAEDMEAPMALQAEGSGPGALQAEGSGPAALEAEGSGPAAQQQPLTLEEVLADESDTLKNIIYTETVYDFETTQSPSGTANSLSAYERTIADTLQTSIVPQTVSAILEKYPAFQYLNGSSIGIGLRLYSDAGSSTLASVSLQTAYHTSSDGKKHSDTLIYSLSVNLASVGDLSDDAKRSSLEQTIAHEMIHAFMDEATTVGMTGLSPSGSANQKFPSWFVEGMAQTSSGPGNWTRGVSLSLTENSTDAEIRAALSGGNALGTGSTASEYGTGYLACMYLGYLASGGTANMSDPTGAASAISKGLSDILAELIAGKSLNAAISKATSGKYSSVSAFQSGFASDTSALGFIHQLLHYTSTADSGGNVGGGLIGGDLSKTDPVADNTIPGLKLFALDTAHTEVQNKYPSEVTVLSGGGISTEGVSPLAPVVPVTYPTNVFTVTGGVEGTDWTFDTATGALHILTGQALTISGGTLQDSTGTYYGNIVIDGTSADLTLDGVTIDASKKTGSTAGIQIGNGCSAKLSMTGTNTIKGGQEAAGIQLYGNRIYGKSATEQTAEHNAVKPSSVRIEMQAGSKLDVAGDTAGSKGGAGIGAAWATDTSKSDITITGTGTITANGGIGGAGIGGSEGGSIGNISIQGNGLHLTAVGGQHGAGIGGGGWVSTYSTPDVQKVESITITGDTVIKASSRSHGTGIGGGCHGEVGTITIGSSPADPSERVKIESTGGDDGAGIGAGWAGKMGSITINSGEILATAGNNGAGIGSGYSAEGGQIVIRGGTITAKGSTNSSGIGGGKDGTIAGIVISGGTITADGGWTNDGGNIGGYTDKSGTTKATVTMTDPSGLTIKAGEKGEGKYITTGTTDSAGTPLYALDMAYIGQLLADGKVTLTDPGGDPTTLSYPLTSISVSSPGGSPLSWSNLQHMTEDNAYIWAYGEDITLTFTDGDGTSGSVDLKFYPDYGLWRMDASDLPPELPKEPGYVITPRPTPTPSSSNGAIILQIGPHASDTLRIPRFYFSRNALKLDEYDISTLERANSSIAKAHAMIDRVSEIRGTYGALDNALEHVIHNLNTNEENLTAAESRIRDTDMALEITGYTKNNILLQSAQAMLAQANAVSRNVLSFIQG